MPKSFCLCSSFKISRTNRPIFLPGPDYLALIFDHVSGETVSELASLDIIWNWLPSVSLYFFSLRIPRRKIATVKKMKKMDACNASDFLFKIYIF